MGSRPLFETLKFVLLTAIAGGIGICLVFVTLYHAFAVNAYADDVFKLFTGNNGLQSLLIGVALYTLPAYLIYHLLRQGHALPKHFFLPAYLLIGTAICALYGANIHPSYVSDFGRMWEAAVSLANDGFSPAQGIFEQRSLFVLYPMMKLLGANEASLVVGNSIIFLSIGLLGYFAFQIERGELGAQAFSFVWLCSFEPVMAIAIPTHDLWGAFFTALSVLAIAHASRGMNQHDETKTLYWAVILGVLLALLQAQRELGVILLLSTILVWGYICLANRIEAARTLFGPTVIVSAFVLSNLMLGSLGLLSPKTTQEELDTARIAGFASSFSSGRFADGVATRDLFLDPLPSAQSKRALAESIFLSDIVEHPEHRPSNALARLTLLANPGSQVHFYLAGVSEKASQRVRALSAISSVLVFGLGILATFAVWRRPRGRLQLLTAVLVLFAGGGVIAFSTVAEVQPRYAFFMWFVTAVIVSDALLPGDLPGEVAPPSCMVRSIYNGGGPQRMDCAIKPTWAVTMMFVFIIGFVGWSLLALVYSPRHGRVLANWDFLITQHMRASPQEVEALIRAQDQPTNAFSQSEGYRVPPSLGKLATTLLFPSRISKGDRISARQPVCLGEMDGLALYVLTPFLTPSSHELFELSILEDGVARSRIGLDDSRTLKAVKVPLSRANRCVVLELALSARKTPPDDSARLASRVEIIFPRLIKLEER